MRARTTPRVSAERRAAELVAMAEFARERGVERCPSTAELIASGDYTLELTCRSRSNHPVMGRPRPRLYRPSYAAPRIRDE